MPKRSRSRYRKARAGACRQCALSLERLECRLTLSINAPPMPYESVVFARGDSQHAASGDVQSAYYGAMAPQAEHLASQSSDAASASVNAPALPREALPDHLFGGLASSLDGLGGMGSFSPLGRVGNYSTASPSTYVPMGAPQTTTQDRNALEAEATKPQDSVPTASESAAPSATTSAATRLGPVISIAEVDVKIAVDTTEYNGRSAVAVDEILTVYVQSVSNYAGVDMRGALRSAAQQEAAAAADPRLGQAALSAANSSDVSARGTTQVVPGASKDNATPIAGLTLPSHVDSSLPTMPSILGLNRTMTEPSGVPQAVIDPNAPPVLRAPQYDPHLRGATDVAQSEAEQIQASRAAPQAMSEGAATAQTLAEQLVELSSETGRAALVASLPLNFEAVDQALDAMAQEIERLGGELASWFDPMAFSGWTAAASVAVATGVGGYLWYGRNRAALDDRDEEESSSWLFTRLHTPAGRA